MTRNLLQSASALVAILVATGAAMPSSSTVSIRTCGAATSSFAGQTYRLSPRDNWLNLINGEGLQPGDTVILDNGRYLTPDNVMLNIAHVGTAAHPITIRAAAGARVVFTRNTIGAFNDF